MKKAKKTRNYYVIIKPFDNYCVVYFCNRNRTNEGGLPVSPYFLKSGFSRAEHSFEEAQETIHFLNEAYPQKQFMTVSKQQVSNHELKELINTEK